jgi:hypothetical protein
MHQFFKMFYVKKYNKKLTYINILLKKHIWSTADGGSNRWCIFNARAQRSACWLIWAWKSIRIQKLLHFSVEDADRGGYRVGTLSYLNPAVYNTHLSWLGVSIYLYKINDNNDAHLHHSFIQETFYINHLGGGSVIII